MRYNWLYDETKHCGVDFSDPELVAIYDSNHQKFRDYEKGAAYIAQALNLNNEQSVIDMGAGTGAFALYAAKYCKQIYAVDISKVMLDYAKQKAEKMGVKNVIFCHGGFLTYEHKDEPVDAFISVAVLHHLPDFWKLIGLKRAFNMIKTGGKFYLFDVTFPSEIDNYENIFDGWVESQEKQINKDFGREVEITIRDEYVTFDWIMEGLLERAGFKIDNISVVSGFGSIYICKK